MCGTEHARRHDSDGTFASKFLPYFFGHNDGTFSPPSFFAGVFKS